MWGYYFFFTLYMIPHNALIPELIQDSPLWVNAYTISSFFFVTGSNMRRCACQRFRYYPCLPAKAKNFLSD